MLMHSADRINQVLTDKEIKKKKERSNKECLHGTSVWRPGFLRLRASSSSVAFGAAKRRFGAAGRGTQNAEPRQLPLCRARVFVSRRPL